MEKDIRKDIYKGYTLHNEPKTNTAANLLAATFPLSCLYSMYPLYMVYQETSPLPIIISVILGWLFADFASGLVHWLGDNYFARDTKIIGEVLILPFRHHHVEPTSICSHNFLLMNANNFAISSVGLLLVASSISSFGLDCELYSFSISAAIFSSLTNQFHAWAHALEPPFLAKVLFKMRIIQSPANHTKHHRLPHNSDYCITTGALNPLLDKIRFFRFLEKVIFCILKVSPEHESIAFHIQSMQNATKEEKIVDKHTDV